MLTFKWINLSDNHGNQVGGGRFFLGKLSRDIRFSQTFFFSILPDYHDYPDYERKREITITVVAATQVRGAIGVPPDCAQSNSGAVARVLSDLADREVGRLLISFFTQRNQVRRGHPITPDYTWLCDFDQPHELWACVAVYKWKRIMSPKRPIVWLV